PRGGELRFGHGGRAAQVTGNRRLIEGHVLALGVAPVDFDNDAAAQYGYAPGLVAGSEMVVFAPGNGKGLRPPAVEALATVGLDDETALVIGSAFGIVGERWPNLLTGGVGGPPVGCRARRDVRGGAPPAQDDQGHAGQRKDQPKTTELVRPRAIHRSHRPTPFFGLILLGKHYSIGTGPPSGPMYSFLRGASSIYSPWLRGCEVGAASRAALRVRLGSPDLPTELQRTTIG